MENNEQKYTVAPTKRPDKYGPQWAISDGTWEVATLWSKDAADWIAELMNTGYGAIIEKKITEAVTRSRLGEVPEETSTSS